MEINGKIKKLTLRFGVDSPAMNHPFSNLPYLKDGDRTIFESQAIHLQIALRSKHEDLFGSDND
jgi:glutathione S-transferase